VIVPEPLPSAFFFFYTPERGEVAEPHKSEQSCDEEDIVFDGGDVSVAHLNIKKVFFLICLPCKSALCYLVQFWVCAGKLCRCGDDPKVGDDDIGADAPEEEDGEPAEE